MSIILRRPLDVRPGERMRELPRDLQTRETVLRAVKLGFPPERRAAVPDLLDDASSKPDSNPSPRVQLAVLTLAGAREEQLDIDVKAAESDKRDVLAWASSGSYPERPTGRVELQKQLFAELGIPYPEDGPVTSASPRRRVR
jgi:hypothetical protein